MNRRDVISVIMVAPAMARQALTEGKWLTIATPGWNRNNRKYSEAALASMAAGIKGRLIIKRAEADMLPDEQSLLRAAVGAVTDSRRGAEGSVQVQVKWLKSAGAVEGVLAPWGVGKAWTEDKPGHFEITEYEVNCLELTNWSGWENASQI